MKVLALLLLTAVAAVNGFSISAMNGGTCVCVYVYVLCNEPSFAAWEKERKRQ